MQIADGTVVAMDYALKDDEGTLIDQSQPGQPMVYLHGHGNIIPGLEAALAGKLVGETAEVRVDPENGYGEVNPALEQVVPKDRFQGVEDLQAGMQFQANTDQGPVSVRVVKVDDDDVTVDGNHPLAGKHLNFNVTIQEVRAATEEEIAHGHIHQGGGCCGGGADKQGGCCNDEPESQGGCCNDEPESEGGCCSSEESKADGQGGCCSQ
ncbi:MAG: peptidylprolyl isomerase [Opitutaceae bacterium BACL24 MAG-120322-bin51]|jgi:FKBP-type peptidyl-prolyl cis-trans isomerase SlyD|nr:MAG: peptidylprolyl isomerase [Opitutaceae bacterium BACL24 MAG-120322-bin51]